MVEFGHIARLSKQPGKIGVGTTSPLAKLHVSGRGFFGTATADTGAGLQISDSTAPYFSVEHSVGATFSFGANASGAQIASDLGTIEFKTGNTWNAHPATSGTTRMAITNAGNVGIGTTSPVAKFQIATPASGHAFSVGDPSAWHAFSVNYQGSIWGARNMEIARSTTLGSNMDNFDTNPALKINPTSFFTGNLIDLQSAGVSRMIVTAPGNVGVSTMYPLNVFA